MTSKNHQDNPEETPKGTSTPSETGESSTSASTPPPATSSQLEVLREDARIRQYAFGRVADERLRMLVSLYDDIDQHYSKMQELHYTMKQFERSSVYLRLCAAITNIHQAIKDHNELTEKLEDEYWTFQESMISEERRLMKLWEKDEASCIWWAKGVKTANPNNKD